MRVGLARKPSSFLTADSQMERVILGDNQFFSVNHLSDEKARAQSLRFRDDESIIRVLDQSIDAGVNGFMCTTHDRMAGICQHIRDNPTKYRDYNLYPCMPYAHKYANAVTELGFRGAIRQYVPGSLLATAVKGGAGLIRKDYLGLMRLFIDAEMKMFKGIHTPVIFLQNVAVDLILGLGMYDLFREYDSYIRDRFHAEPGYITMNMPVLFDALEMLQIHNPIICTSINRLGFRMSGGMKLYEEYLRTKRFRPVAMQTLAAGALSPRDAIEYLGRFPGIRAVVFGASSKSHILETRDLIKEYLEIETVPPRKGIGGVLQS